MNNFADKFNIKALGLSGALAAGLLLAGHSAAKAQDAPPPPPDRPEIAQGVKPAPPNDNATPRSRRRRGDVPPPPLPVQSEANDRPEAMPPPPADAMPDRPGTMPPPPDAMIDRPGAMPLPAMNPAMEQGMRDGLLQGEQDRASGKGFRPQKARAYKKATNGFQYSNGDRQFYKDNYRQGFLRGYDQSFGGNLRSGLNAPPPPARDRPQPGREGARRPMAPAPRAAPPINN